MSNRNELGGNAMTQNLSGLMEREAEENEMSTEQKYWYNDALSTSKEK